MSFQRHLLLRLSSVSHSDHRSTAPSGDICSDVKFRLNWEVWGNKFHRHTVIIVADSVYKLCLVNRYSGWKYWPKCHKKFNQIWNKLISFLTLIECRLFSWYFLVPLFSFKSTNLISLWLAGSYLFYCFCELLDLVIIEIFSNASNWYLLMKGVRQKLSGLWSLLSWIQLDRAISLFFPNKDTF